MIETGGDCLARYMVRMKEMRQSLPSEQLIDNIPEGDRAVPKSRTETACLRTLFERNRNKWRIRVYIVSEGGTTPCQD